MSYSAEISRDNPTALIFVIDQSLSMREEMRAGTSKAQFVSTILNRTFSTLIGLSTKEANQPPRHYFDIGVVAYGSGETVVSPGFKGALGGQYIHSISDIANNVLRVEEREKRFVDDTGEVTAVKSKFRVWVDPVAEGGTPMRAAMEDVAGLVAEWCDSHPNSFPPTVLHVTDGESQDGDPEQNAEVIRSLGTNDGNVLLYNLHVSGPNREIYFPSNERELPSPYGQMLFRMSSELPAHAVGLAKTKGFAVEDGCRGMMFNAGAELIADFFEIGTRPRLIAPR